MKLVYLLLLIAVLTILSTRVSAGRFRRGFGFPLDGEVPQEQVEEQVVEEEEEDPDAYGY